jgi:AcrR family transcriptional regulator
MRQPALTRTSTKKKRLSTLIERRPTGDLILSASAKVFAKRGYGETSLRDLMAAAGVSTTAFYVRFASKEEVLHALVERLLADLQAATAQTLAAGGDVGAGFQRGVEAMTKVLLEHRIAVRLALTEAPSVPRTRDALAKAYGALAKLLGTRLGELAHARDAGDALGWALVGALAMQVQRWAVFEELDDRGLARALAATARTLMPGRAASRKRRSGA